MVDYILVGFSLGSIFLSEIYLIAMERANKIQKLWILEVTRLALGMLFTGIVIAACLYLASLFDSNFLDLKITPFIPLFNFGTSLALQWNRSIRTLGPQRDWRKKPSHKD